MPFTEEAIARVRKLPVNSILGFLATPRSFINGDGLSAGILTRNFDQALALAERLDSGIVHINDQTVHDEPQAPFGGMKESGWGRMGGRAAMEEFTELRWITVQREPRHFPF